MTSTSSPAAVAPPPTLSTPIPLSPTPATLAVSPVQSSSPRPREASNPPETKNLYKYRHPKHQRTPVVIEKEKEVEKENKKKDNNKIKEKEEKYNPLSISNLLKKEPSSNFTSTSDNLTESRRTPESDRTSSKSSISSKRRRMLPEGRTPSPAPSLPLPRPWSPGLDPKDTPVDYSLPITTMYLKHQQRILAEKNKADAAAAAAVAAAAADAAAAAAAAALEEEQRKSPVIDVVEVDSLSEIDRFSPAAGLIDTNLNLLATIQHLHCQVMLALTERLRPSILPTPLMLPPSTAFLASGFMGIDMSIPTALHHQS